MHIPAIIAALAAGLSGSAAAVDPGQQAADVTANRALESWSDCIDVALLQARDITSDAALADRAFHDCAADEAAMNGAFAAAYSRHFASPEMLTAHGAKFKADYRAVMLAEKVPAMRADPAAYAADLAADRAARTEFYAASQKAQADGDAWFSCLTARIVTGLTKGDLAVMSDDVLTKRVKAGFAACAPQESAYAAHAPDPAAREKAITAGRAQFHGAVISEWSNVRDEARRQGAK